MKNSIPCRKMFTDTLLQLALQDKEIIAVTTDARGSVTLSQFADELPNQFVECGIAEQNAVGIAAGLAAWGKKPFVCAPACFLSTRSLEQIKVDVAYSLQNVKIFGVSGGVSYGALGMSHHSLQDAAAMRAIPNMSIVFPSDRWQTRELTKTLVNYKGPVYFRVGRNAVPDVYSEDNVPFKLGKANMLCDGTDATIIANGEMTRHSLDAANKLKELGLQIRVLDMHTIKPLDVDAIIKAAEQTSYIITVEEHSVFGGLGAAVAQVVSENHPVKMRILGIPDEPVITGNSSEVFDHYGLNGEGISKTIMELFKK